MRVRLWVIFRVRQMIKARVRLVLRIVRDKASCKDRIRDRYRFKDRDRYSVSDRHKFNVRVRVLV